MSHKQLVVDYRERELIKLLHNYSHITPIITENLAVGDILFRIKETPVFIIERKTIPDLVASIKDGRYRNQKQRIHQAFKPNQCLYLIEGNLPSVDCEQIQNLSVKSVYGSIIHTMFRDGNFVYRTHSVEESAAFISDLDTRWRALTTDWFQVSDNNTVISCPMKRKGDISPITCFEYQLSQIPSISNNKAKIISSKFPSMKSLITYLDTIPSDDRVHNLVEQCVVQVGDKQKKIGKSSALKIINFLGFCEK
jgi:ERCC4-type nuclease